MAFICGSFNNQDQEDDFEVLWPTPSPSRKTKTHCRFCCRLRGKSEDSNKNPYSNRGLEKFEALLADLDDKKQKIFTQKGSQYISFVRFVYSNSNDVKPIIVKLRDPRKITNHDHHRKKNNFKDSKKTNLSLSLPKKLELCSSSFNHGHHHNRRNSEPPGKMDTQKDLKGIPKPNELIGEVVNKIRVDELKMNMRRKLEEWWMPSYNLPLFVILVLFFLTFFGRSLAIVCTSIAWYLIPTIDGTLENATPKPKKAIKIEKSNEINRTNMITSPKTFLSGPINVQQKRNMKKLMISTIK
ncbi:hypothetical protein OSB04_004883 [Centaurea solstitialis]|uniref:ZCF37 n=1 Tax=Centaurea solstitialis TaxID=347529 RepID=A0AA38TEX3_9ASTR|nr:hypothetical protein OSB04_004883 [Centaurea solstitialis]